MNEFAVSIAFLLCASLLCGAAGGDAPAPPIALAPATPVGVVRMNDGSYAYYDRRRPTRRPVLRAADGTEMEAKPHIPFSMPRLARYPERMLMDQQGELHALLLRRRGSGRRIGIDRFIDIYHIRTVGGRARWTPPRPAWRGYTGAVMMFAQLRSGRLVIPFAEWIPGRAAAPPTGANETTVIYSDDGGATWRRSPARLTAPCREGYNGSNYGACEPSIIQLKDGRIWMIMRTQTGYLYESWSRDGVHWSPARPTRFRSSTGPPALLRLPDGRIVLFWNHCALPPRVNGQGVYGGRDALHAAISDDEGATWRGYREIYRDPFRNRTPPRRGDRGVAYPFPSFDAQGRMLVHTGQGRGRRAFILVDPDWLTANHAEDDFSHGLGAWHTFKSFGPVVHWWRDRTDGPALADHPSKPGAKVLHVRRPDEKPADGATWNFPAFARATLTLRVRLNPGSAGGAIALTDRLFNPCDDNGERLAPFLLILPDDLPALADHRWHTVALRWSLARRLCLASVDGKEAKRLRQRYDAPEGLSYLRLRSRAKSVDPAGFFVESVAVVAEPGD